MTIGHPLQSPISNLRLVDNRGSTSDGAPEDHPFEKGSWCVRPRRLTLLCEVIAVNVFVGLYHHCIQKRPEKKDFITNRTFRPHGLPQQKLFAEEAREGETSCL